MTDDINDPVYLVVSVPEATASDVPDWDRVTCLPPVHGWLKAIQHYKDAIDARSGKLFALISCGLLEGCEVLAAWHTSHDPVTARVIWGHAVLVLLKKTIQRQLRLYHYEQQRLADLEARREYDDLAEHLTTVRVAE